MSKRIRVDGRLYEAVEDSDESKIRKVKAVLTGLDADQLVDAWNAYCEWGDDRDSRVLPMSDFDWEFEGYSRLEVAELVHDAGGNFNPGDDYFWIGRGLTSGSKVSDIDMIDLDALAEGMVEAEDPFDVDAAAGLV